MCRERAVFGEVCLGLALAAISVLAVGCPALPEASTIEGLACDVERRCLPGFSCVRSLQICVTEEVCADTDADGYCAVDDCDSDAPDCTTDCTDADGDGVPACAGDCDDTNAHCQTLCSDADGDGWCTDLDCDDQRPGCDSSCVDADEDGLCGPRDCDDTAAACGGDCDTDLDADNVADCRDGCVDFDGDGVGAETGDRTDCLVDIVDIDDHNILRCGDSDADLCDDCINGPFNPANDGPDTDADGLCDDGDRCQDIDGDGLGDGTHGNVDCIVDATDWDDEDVTICADLDLDECDDCFAGEGWNMSADGADPDRDGICNAGDSRDNDPLKCIDTDGDDCDDCSKGMGWDPNNDGTDEDRDGVCDLADCNDKAPNCASECTVDSDADGIEDCADSCTDFDGDGYGMSHAAINTCLGTDCEDNVPSCSLDCTDSDRDGVVDCVETACTTDPNDSSDTCVVINRCASGDTAGHSLSTAIDLANTTPGKQKILATCHRIFIDDVFTVASADAGCIEFRSIYQVALSVSRAARLEFYDNDCLVDNVKFVGGERVIVMNGERGLVRDSEFREAGDFAIDIGGTESTVLNNAIYYTRDYGASIRVNASAIDTVISGNLIAVGDWDGLRITGSTRTTFDHNSIIGNGGDGVYIYTTPPTDLCARYNIFFRNDNSAWNTWFDSGFKNLDFADDCGSFLTEPGSWGNVVADADPVCLTFDCGASCECLPDNFWSDASVEPEKIDNNGCTTQESLVDAAEDLSYDLNGSDPGRFAGSKPDIGGRESGSSECP